MKKSILFLITIYCYLAAYTIHIKSPFSENDLRIFGNTNYGWAIQSSTAMNSEGKGWYAINSATNSATEQLSICNSTNWDASTAPLGSIANLFSGNTSATDVWVVMSKTGVVSITFTDPDGDDGDGDDDNKDTDSTRVISAIIRDQAADGVEFQGGATGHKTGMVQDTLSVDGKPLKGAVTAKSTNLESWFENNNHNDTCIEMVWKKNTDGSWEYNSDDYGGFFPIDDFNHPNNSKGSLPHNYHFTMELHTQFEYKKGTAQLFEFSGDDDVWIFVNRKLAIDIGGIHGAISGSVNLDVAQTKLGLIDGETYSLDIFFCERQTSGSNFRAKTSIDISNDMTLFYDSTFIDKHTTKFDIKKLDIGISDECGFNINDKDADTLGATALFTLTGPHFGTDSKVLAPGKHYGGITNIGDSSMTLDKSQITGLIPGTYTVLLTSKDENEFKGKIVFTIEKIFKNLILPDTIFVPYGSDTVVEAQGVQITDWSGTDDFTLLNDSLIKITPESNAEYKVINYVEINIENENMDFEEPVIPLKNYKIMSQDDIPGWKTTASDGKIELWSSGFQGVPAYEGKQFAELNANMVGQLYQDIETPPGTVVEISFAHRGRSGVDTMGLKAGPPGGPYAELGTYRDGTSDWGFYREYYQVPEGQTTTRIFFTSEGYSSSSVGMGNFLDAVKYSVVLEDARDSVQIIVNYGLPVVTTNAVTEISQYSARCGGEVTGDGGAAISSRGICLSKSSTPDTSDTRIESGSGLGSFSVELDSLDANQKYYVRAYAINATGIAYGEVRNFTTETASSASLTASPGDTTYSSPELSIELTTDEGNRIYYTLDGSTPDTTDETQLLSGGESTGTVEISGDVTIRATALGDTYLPTTKSWRYTQELPQLYVEASPGGITSGTISFYFDTTVTFRALDSTGELIEDTEIYYLLDDGAGPLITVESGTLFSGEVKIDSTMRIQAIAVSPNYKSGTGEWLCTMKSAENSITVQSFCHSHMDGALIEGKEASGSRDTLPFGSHLKLVLASDCDLIEYAMDGEKWQQYSDGDTLIITEDYSDTVEITLRSEAHGYEPAEMALVVLRDTVDGLLVTPEEENFLKDKIIVTASLKGDWIHGEIFVDTSSEMTPYEKPLILNESRAITFEARADFAISQNISKSYYAIASVDSAWYMDSDGDGAIDSLCILTNRENLGRTPDSLKIHSPFSDEERVVYADAIGASKGLLSLSFPAFSFDGITGFAQSQLGTLHGKGYTTEPVAISDKVAPVLTSAKYYPGEIVEMEPVVTRAVDTLVLTYSEVITLGDSLQPTVFVGETEADPFEIVDATLQTRTMSIKDSIYSYTQALFTVDTGAHIPSTGDSLNIATESFTADTTGVQQTHEENRAVEINVRPIPYALLVKALSPVDPQKDEIPQALTPSEYSLQTGVVITIDFLIPLAQQNQNAAVSIFDAVGNKIIQIDGMDDNSENLFVQQETESSTKLTVYWSGRNALGRFVGSGSYKAMLRIDDGQGEKIDTSIMLGIINSN